jgi:hypothetical protein
MSVVVKKGVKPAAVQLSANLPLSLPAVKMEAKQGKATISTQTKDGQETEQQLLVGEAILSAEPMANVGVSMGMTKNLGDYNNIKFQITLHMPCMNDPDSISETYEKAKAWVDGKVDALNTEIIEQLS